MTYPTSCGFTRVPSLKASTKFLSPSYAALLRSARWLASALNTNSKHRTYAYVGIDLPRCQCKWYDWRLLICECPRSRGISSEVAQILSGSLPAFRFRPFVFNDSWSLSFSWCFESLHFGRYSRSIYWLVVTYYLHVGADISVLVEKYWWVCICAFLMWFWECRVCDGAMNMAMI